MGIVRKTITVSGRVQGVGYRYFARDLADELWAYRLGQERSWTLC